MLSCRRTHGYMTAAADACVPQCQNLWTMAMRDVICVFVFDGSA